ncbi:MAG TPA: hypothetical protein VG944_03395 [Fimbriimonas sp.]|nr:hypothetical protein [Fimbriimonas sp.]
MYVPNYIPEPLEVPGNVTLDPYPTRVRFIRTVTYLHLGSLAVVGALASVPLPQVRIGISLAILSVLLILMDVLRICLRGKPLEAKISGALLPVVLLVVAFAVIELQKHFPVWAFAAGPAACGVYTLVCGRDYSFVGCFFLSWITSSVIIAALAAYFQLTPGQAAFGLSVNFAYLSYYVYDLAALLARRRRDEALAAVVDLYRDVFNIFGYLLRVIGHWKKHRIWVSPR